MEKRIAVIGDPTTTGGRIISGNQRVTGDGSPVALLGDKTTCPKCKSIGTIIEGAKNWIVDGKPVAYDGCVIACKCSPVGHNKIIASHSCMFVDVATSYNTTTCSLGNTSSIQSDYTNEESNNLIRIDASRLLKCADELCEKHLYHKDIKQAFIEKISNFANDIVDQVDNHSMTYEQGSEKIKEEEDSLWKQSLKWLTNGLSVFGGVGMVMAGWALCSTGVGCLIGAPLMLHGVNSAYEGGVGLASGVANVFDGGNRDLNISGPLRKVYQTSATALGFDASVGDLTYDLIDFGISIRGKLKLVPKLNELGNPKFKLFFYGRQDLEKAYLQMSKKLLSFEIFSDTLTLINVYEDLKKAFVLDNETQQVRMVVSESEKISNVKDIIDDCSLVVTITGDNDDTTPGYYLCERVDGSKYKKDYSGNITEGGLTH